MMTRKRALPTIIKTLLKILLVGLISLLLLELLLQLAFNNLPDALKQRMPQAAVRYGIQFDTLHGAREYPANENVNLTITSYSGDLYALTCLSPADAPEVEPYTVRYTRDDHGFRNVTPWPDDVDIVFIGDSFTAAESIERPYWQDIAPNALTLGLPGSGSLEQLLLLREFGLPRSPETVVMAYFGGNDITDTWRFHQTREAGETLYSQANQNRRPWEYLVTFQMGLWLRDLFSSAGTTENCPYPVMDVNDTPLAFYADFLETATVSRDAWQDSAIFAPTREAILSAAQETREQGGQFILVYIPHKAEVYWSLLDQSDQADIAQQITPLTLTDNELVDMTGLNTDEKLARLKSNMSAQRELLSQLAAEHDFQFLDLTLNFRMAANDGINTYFFSDTHWNQAGHDLAGQIIRNFLNNEPSSQN